MFRELILPLTYEELVKAVENDLARMTDLVVPVTEFESQIIQIVQEMRRSGYLLFIFGVSGTGKSTFLSSLKWRKHIPITEIKIINANALSDPDNPGRKLKKLSFEIQLIARQVSEESPTTADAKTCVVIDYLESLKDEDEHDIYAFFRDLNAILRQAPILIVWPVTVREDMELMQRLASSFSSTMFHRRIPAMEFTGPHFEDFPAIARKTIAVLNPGYSHHDFQLNDGDFDKATKKILTSKKPQQTIREYLQTIREIWEERTDYVSQVRRKVPGNTEIWFVVCYPDAEGVVAQFAKRSQHLVEDAWNADYSKLSEYTRDNQRAADWPTHPVNRLALALTGVLTTKILFLPTNTFINCVAAYGDDPDVSVPISRKQLEELDVPAHWFQKSKALLTLKTTPLYHQLAGESASKGDRRGGTAAGALEVAGRPYEYINKLISGGGDNRNSDKSFNRAIAKALRESFQDRIELDIRAEAPHPWLKVTPDILITTKDNKYICIEFFYTVNTQSNRLAQYCLNKLNTYMKQVESLYESDQLQLI